MAPFAGAISDLIGRRYVALLGALFVCIGMIIVGTAHRMDVAIGGMAMAGVGAGLSELVGAAGIFELAPVKSRGKYIGVAFLLILPFSASAAYGTFSVSCVKLIVNSSVVLCLFYLEMGCLDPTYHQRGDVSHDSNLLLASTSS